jgi:hypothetical protein
MSKKLIALASATALALSALVGVAPANADVGATFHRLAADGTTDSGSVTVSATAAAENAATPTLSVPSNNYLIVTDTAARSTVLKVKVATAVGEVVTASSSGALKILDLNGVGEMGTADYKLQTTAGVDYTSTAGAQSLSRTATTDNVSFYVFTTSTTAASLTITKGGNTRVVWIRGAEGAAYNITAALPASIPVTAPASNNVIAKITDVFGNTVTADVILTTSTTGSDITLTPATGSTFTYSSTDGGHGLKLNKTTSGGFAMSLFITADPADVTGLSAASSTVFLTTTVADQGAQITALTAQVAALQATMLTMRTFERSVTKKKYNTLARKWNKAFPSQAVKLKPPLVK